MKLGSFANIHQEVFAHQEWAQKHREEKAEQRIKKDIKRYQPSSSNREGVFQGLAGVVPKGKKQKGFKGDVSENVGNKHCSNPVISARTRAKLIREGLLL